MIRALGRTAVVGGDPVVTQFLLLGPLPVPLHSGYRSDGGVFLPFNGFHGFSLVAGLVRFFAPLAIATTGGLIVTGTVASPFAYAALGVFAFVMLLSYVGGRVPAREAAIREASQPLLGVAADLARVDRSEADRVALEIQEVLGSAGVLDWRLALVEAEKQDAQRLGFLLLRVRAEMARAPEKAAALEKTTDQLLALIAKKRRAPAPVAPIAPIGAPAAAVPAERKTTRTSRMTPALTEAALAGPQPPQAPRPESSRSRPRTGVVALKPKSGPVVAVTEAALAAPAPAAPIAPAAAAKTKSGPVPAATRTKSGPALVAAAPESKKAKSGPVAVPPPAKPKSGPIAIVPPALIEDASSLELAVPGSSYEVVAPLAVAPAAKDELSEVPFTIVESSVEHASPLLAAPEPLLVDSAQDFALESDEELEPAVMLVAPAPVKPASVRTPAARSARTARVASSARVRAASSDRPSRRLAVAGR